MDFTELQEILPLPEGVQNQTNEITGEPDSEYEGPEPTAAGDHAERHNTLSGAINAIADALGADPTGGAADLTTALANIAATLSGKQPLDTDLTAIAALTTTTFGRELLELANAAAGRSKLGLGSAATESAGAFQPIDSDLTAIAALTTTSFGRALLELANAAAGRTALGLGTSATEPYESSLAHAGIVTPLMVDSLQFFGGNITATENRLMLVRCIVPKTGKLRDLAFWVTTKSGLAKGAVYDTGQANAGEYTRLYESESFEPGTSQAYNVICDPNLSVTAGQHIMLGVIVNNATLAYGRIAALGNIGLNLLPANFLAGGVEGKLSGRREVGSFTIPEKITEVNMSTNNANPPMIIARIT